MTTPEKDRLEHWAERLAEGDSFVVIEELNQQEDPQAVVTLYDELARHLYWQRKDLPAAIAIARAGIQYGLTMAQGIEAKNVELAAELRSGAKAMAYNLASFAWPGWAEPGIVVGQSDLRFGLDAARTNLRLAQSLHKGDLPVSRAYWMLGAQQLASRQLAPAKNSFDQAAQYAQAAAEQAEALLATGFSRLIDLLASPDETQTKTAQTQLAEVKAVLAKQDNGQFLIDQLDTALKVFTASDFSAPK